MTYIYFLIGLLLLFMVTLNIFIMISIGEIRDCLKDKDWIILITLYSIMGTLFITL